MSIHAESYCQATSQAGEHYAPDCPRCAPLGRCRWFLLCDNAATHTQAHPILGDVPICDRCQAKYDENA